MIGGKAKKPEAAALGAADIAQRIETLKAEVSRLNRLQYDLAAQSVEDPKIEEQYQRCIADSVEAQREIDRLQAALIGIDRREKREAAAGRATARRDQFCQFETAMQKRQAAVEEIAAGVEAATIAYSKFLAACAQAEQLVPAGVTLPMHVQSLEVVAGGPPLACGPASAIAAEMYRIANGARLSLPGAKAPNLQTVEKPMAIEPLAVGAARQGQAIVARVREQIERAEQAEKTQAAA